MAGGGGLKKGCAWGLLQSAFLPSRLLSISAGFLAQLLPAGGHLASALPFRLQSDLPRRVLGLGCEGRPTREPEGSCCCCCNCRRLEG